MVTIIKLESPKETLWGVAYDGEVILTASSEARAKQLADEIFGVLE